MIDSVEALLNKVSKDRITTREIREQRLSVCLSCPELIELTTTCRQCSCFMSFKTWLIHSHCPLNKWS